MLQDIRFGIRVLFRSPGFSLLVVLCLTVGIGVTTAVLSWMEGILLRPFPMVANQECMVAITGLDRNDRTDISWPDFQDLRRNSTLAESFIAEHIGGATLNIGQRADRATGSVVSANYFDALGIRPVLGRTFDASEDTGRGAHPVVVISYDAWKQRYAGDPAIIGRVQMLNGVPHTIIGVAPEGFYGTFVGYSFTFWVPASMEDTFEGGGYKLDKRDARWIEGFEILKPGVSIEQAQLEASAIGRRLESIYPDTDRGRGFKLYPLWATPFNNAGTLLPTLRISLVVAALMLLIACANVGNLMLVRAFSRQQEVSVRLSLGAARWRLIKQLLVESLLLSLAAGAGGLLLAHWGRNLITLLFPPTPAGVVIHLPAQIDWRVLAISGGLCVVTAIVFGMMPAFQANKVHLAAVMKAEAAGVVGGRRKAWVRSALVAGQVALSFTLLVGAALLLKSLNTMQASDVGFSKETLAGSIDLVGAGYNPARIRNFQNEFQRRAQRLPGIESLVWVRNVPFTFKIYSSSPIAVDGFEVAPGEQPTVEFNEVGPGYLAAMGIPLISGRDFNIGDNETSLPVAVVNQTMVERFFRGQDPVGKRIRVRGRWLQIAGIAANSKYSSLLETAKPFFYVPIRQGLGGQSFQIRARLDSRALATPLLREVKAMDTNLAIFEIVPMGEQVERRSWSQRAAVRLIAVFGGMALLLTGIGLYGLLSYAVSQSKRELGLRLALGANGSDLLRMVVSHGLELTAAGAMAGAILAFGVTRLMGDMLYKVSPRDPVAFGLAFLVMIAAALTASLIPAIRVSRMDPVRALRD